MGKTNPTYRDQLSSLQDEWERTYGRSLRRQHRPAFDRLWNQARHFADAAGERNHVDSEKTVLLTMLHSHEMRIANFEEQLDELRDLD